MKTPVEYLCNPCGLPFASRSVLSAHIDQAHAPLDLSCPFCAKPAVASKKSQLRHIKEVHFGFAKMQQKQRPANVSCPQCPLQFVDPRRSLCHYKREHLGVDADDPLGDCDLCDFVGNDANWRRHFYDRHCKTVDAGEPAAKRSKKEAKPALQIPPPPPSGQPALQIPPPPPSGQPALQIPPPPPSGQPALQIPPPPISGQPDLLTQLVSVATSDAPAAKQDEKYLDILQTATATPSAPAQSLPLLSDSEIMAMLRDDPIEEVLDIEDVPLPQQEDAGVEQPITQPSVNAAPAQIKIEPAENGELSVNELIDMNVAMDWLSASELRKLVEEVRAGSTDYNTFARTQAKRGSKFSTCKICGFKSLRVENVMTRHLNIEHLGLRAPFACQRPGCGVRAAEREALSGHDCVVLKRRMEEQERKRKAMEEQERKRKAMEEEEKRKKIEQRLAEESAERERQRIEQEKLQPLEVLDNAQVDETLEAINKMVLGFEAHAAPAREEIVETTTHKESPNPAVQTPNEPKKRGRKRQNADEKSAKKKKKAPAIAEVKSEDTSHDETTEAVQNLINSEHNDSGIVEEAYEEPAAADPKIEADARPGVHYDVEAAADHLKPEALRTLHKEIESSRDPSRNLFTEACTLADGDALRCKACPYGTRATPAGSALLNAHLNTSHLKLSIRCDYCLVGFPSVPAMRRHVHREHRGEERPKSPAVKDEEKEESPALLESKLGPYEICFRKFIGLITEDAKSP